MTARPKSKPLRSRALLDLAHEYHECSVAIPGVCRGYVVEGLEPAHGPKGWLDGGGAQKSSDVFAMACHWCHVELDQGKLLSRQERGWFWGRGAARTWAILMRDGKLKIA